MSWNYCGKNLKSMLCYPQAHPSTCCHCRQVSTMIHQSESTPSYHLYKLPVASQHEPTPLSQQELLTTTPIKSQHVLTPLSQQETATYTHTCSHTGYDNTTSSTAISNIHTSSPPSIWQCHLTQHDLHFTLSFLASVGVQSCSNFLVWSLLLLNKRKVSNIVGGLGEKNLILKGFHALGRQYFRHTHWKLVEQYWEYRWLLSQTESHAK